MSKILLVEDDNNLREIYEARLMAEGYTIVTAPDGEAALAIASQEKPDLVISDVMMPNISGFDMLDIMRNTNGLKQVHVIMLTALSQAEDQARADALGADRYLVKSQVTLEDIVNNAKVLLGDGEPEPAPAAAPLPTAILPEPVAVAVAPEPIAVAVAPISEPATPPIAEPVTLPPEPAVTPPILQPEPAVAQPIATPPAPVAEPVAAPAPIAEPAVSQPVVTATEPAFIETPISDSSQTPVTDGLSETLASEEATMKAQIEAFVNQAAEPTASVAPTSDGGVITPTLAAVPAPVVEVSQPIVPPQPTVATVPEVAAPPTTAPAPLVAESAVISPAPPAPAADPVAANHDTIMNNAVEQLNAGVSTAPTLAPQRVAVGGNKVIQPITSPTQQPDIHQLLAQEEAKEQGVPIAFQPQATAPGQPQTPAGPRPEDIAL